MPSRSPHQERSSKLLDSAKQTQTQTTFRYYLGSKLPSKREAKKNTKPLLASPSDNSGGLRLCVCLCVGRPGCYVSPALRSSPSRLGGGPAHVSFPVATADSPDDPPPPGPDPQPQGDRPRPAAGGADRRDRGQRGGQELAGVRHDLRGGAAAVRRDLLGLCAPVPRAAGEARRRADREHPAGDRRRRARVGALGRSTVGTIAEIHEYLSLLYRPGRRGDLPDRAATRWFPPRPGASRGAIDELPEGTRYEIGFPLEILPGSDRRRSPGRCSRTA